MKLDIDTHEMTVTTESIQDVAYLKHMGYGDTNPDIHLKVSVRRKFQDGEIVSITLKWEDKQWDGCKGDGSEFVQFVSGPMENDVKTNADIIGGFPYSDPNCKGCGKPLLVENAWMTDGCPCNTPLGVNSLNETRWRLLVNLQQQQAREIEWLRTLIPSKHQLAATSVDTKPFIAERIASDILDRVFEGHIDAKSVSADEAKSIIQELVMRRLTD
jgi:hypothetical protein